ncbi:hypothetical protein INT47_012295 [Mucor saturninus]|uniref:UBA domain-containing protein n=1 Tax=Mucor saturninus TaxID=64648 RepID=A0A8H7QJT3_9FUNG|nr:hypothetical protein INT47_012295 [Mucor saturninus]
MFGKGQVPSKEFDLDALLNATLHDDGDEDLDMNDPDLLKQLQELSSSTPAAAKKKTPTKKQPTQEMNIDIDSYAALAQGEDDIEVDLDESDFNDPHLLNELSALDTGAHESTKVTELINMGFSTQQAVDALQRFDDDLERAANYLFDSPSSPPPLEDEIPQKKLPTPINYDDRSHDDEEEDESIDPLYWKEKAQAYQKSALVAKKEGDKKKAVALLRESKLFHQKFQDLSQLMVVDPRAPTPPAKRELSPPPAVRDPSPPPAVRDPSPPPQSRSVEEQPVVVEPPKPSTAELQQIQDALNQVIRLQKQYKEAALHYKKIGNLSVAKQMIRTSKELLRMGIDLKNGQTTQIPRLPSAPDMNLGDGKIRAVGQPDTTTTKSNNGSSSNSMQQIESQLTYQMNVCHNLAIQNGFSAQKKKSKMMVEESDAYLALESAFATDLVSFKSLNEIPPLHYEQVNYTYKNILDTVPENMMELNIIRCTSLPTLGIAHLEPFVTWDFGGWPPENTAQASMNKGETPVLQGVDPQFDFSLQIPISRTNRLFTRYVSRKKLCLEVFHNKYAYGMFRRPVSIGKVVIPMDRLLTKSSISGVFDILDASRKKTGGKIEIAVNLREPLTGEDIVKRSERWLVLDAFGSTVSQHLSAARMTVGGPLTPQLENLSVTSSPAASSSSIVHSPMVTSSSPLVTSSSPLVTSSSPLVTSSSPLVQTSSPAMTSPPVSRAEEPLSVKAEMKKPKEEVDEELERAEEEFESVDNLVSNMVMEHELGVVNAAMSGAKNKEEWMDRKQAIEIKMNMLVIQVQTGLLDMETYLANVQKRMEMDRRLAIVFKKYNRLDLARAALVRKKIMQDELDEARAAMEQEE